MTFHSASVRVLFLVFVFFLCVPGTLLVAGELFLDEQFLSLERWKSLVFPQIEVQSTYKTILFDSTPSLLARSNKSASALVLKKSFNVYTYPLVAWRWQVSNVFVNGDSSIKAGDDYPIRLYIMFAYDASSASWGQSVQYNIAKLMYGEYPPHSSLNYIWANKKLTKAFLPNPYTDRAMMIPVDQGSAMVGQWVEHQVDIVRDYRAVFGEDPPAVATIAVMADADNTGESASAWIDYITISTRE